MDWFKQLGLGAGLGQMAGGLAGLFGGHGRNPADAANEYFNKIPGKTKQYYEPYMEAGKGALGDLQNQYKDLLGGDVYNKLGAGYKESPGYQFALQQALGAGNNASAAGGMLGTPQHQQQSMETAQGLASQDFQNYLNSQMGLYGLGLQGEQGLNQMGYNANTGYGDMLANIMQQQAQAAYGQQVGQNQGNSKMWQEIFGGGASLLPWLNWGQ